MDTDLLFVLGVVIGGFSVPSIISAFSESRPPRMAMVLIVMAGALIAYATSTHPGGYSFEQIPDVFIRVIGRYIG
ncbi:hypothetical protein [Cochlodiniinecator piscidefendens]|uniref:hypothetical protein n=1 Tax=Cochlodiniinecator piscidefendens TaxID=2715756 RepID=UPI00140916C5|nr:hypothetical protein [Cochlodiniinecator piscidefendens]